MTLGYDRPLYVQPFDHRGSFQTKMFGWSGKLSDEQTAQIAASKRVIYDGLKQAIAEGAPKDKAGILVDEQFESDQKVLEWLETAAKVKGFIGFAVGRTVFWEPLVGWRDNKISRETAANEIARHYRELVDVFEKARIA